MRQAFLAGGVALVAVLGWTRPAAAQRLIDWPIRTTVGAEAVEGGATAAFWNPATAGLMTGRGQAFLMDMEGFRDSGLGGVAVAGAARLPGDVAMAVGFSHLGVGPIGLTTTSPADSLGEVNIAEDLFAFGAARSLPHDLWIGVAAQYSRASSVANNRGEFGLGTGLAWTPGISVQPVLAASVLTRQGATEWLAGVAVNRLLEPVDGLKIGASYGMSGGAEKLGIGHRAALSVHWRDLIGAAAGMVGEPGSTGTTWSLIMGANLQLGRYGLSVLREGIPNGFGAAYYYQLRVAF